MRLNAGFLISLVVLSLNAAARPYAERVNCAGALSTSSAASVIFARDYVIDGRTVRVSITNGTQYAAPPVSDYIEAVMSPDRVPTLSARLTPLFRYAYGRLARGSGLSLADVAQFDLNERGEFTSAQILAAADELRQRGLDSTLASREGFVVRFGTLQFSGTEFWTRLEPVARAGKFVSINPDRGFNRGLAGLATNALSQVQTWASRLFFVWALPMDVRELAQPAVVLLSTSVMTTALQGLLDEYPDTFWRRQLRRLLYFIPNIEGVVDSTQLSSVRNRRAVTLAQNVTDALAAHPGVSHVHIVTESRDEVAIVKRVFATTFADPREREWAEPDEHLAKFPEELRLKRINLNHRPTRDLIEKLTKTYAAKSFTSAEEIINYYRPDRTAGWRIGRENYWFEQIVATYLFDSLRWSLPQFFALNPDPGQIRALMEIPARHFNRGALHEFPSANAVMGTLFAIAAQTDHVLDDQPFARARALVDIDVLPAAEWHGLAETLANPGRAHAAAIRLAPALRPPPPAFTEANGGHAPFIKVAPDLANHPVPKDAWSR